MNQSSRVFRVFLLMLGLLLSSSLSAATANVATITKAVGSFNAVTKTGVERKLQVGDEVAIGESIQTGTRSQVTMKFKVDSRFELGSKAEMTVTAFSRGNPQKQEPPSFASNISVGIFRFVSGLIARESPNAMKVHGAVATIGIRGTNVVGEFQGDTAQVILLEPEGEPHPTAIDVSNQFGSVTIDEPGFGTEVPDANSPPSPPRRMRLRTIDNLMNSIRNVQRVNVPRPRF